MAYTLITGASGGIGAELARIFAREGHDLVLVARSEERLGRLAAQLEGAYGVRAVPLPADLTSEAEVLRVYETTQEQGLVVDNLVNNAGFGDHAAFVESDWERQRNMVQLNVLAMMQLSYLYGADMAEAGLGHILNLSSVAAFSAGPYMSLYYATKGFALSFSQSLNEELRDLGVTVTALCPGPTATGFEKAAGMHDSRMFSWLPVQQPSDVAQIGYQAMQAGRPVAYTSALVRVMNVGSRLVPRAVSTRFAALINQRP